MKAELMLRFNKKEETFHVNGKQVYSSKEPLILVGKIIEAFNCSVDKNTTDIEQIRSLGPTGVNEIYNKFAKELIKIEYSEKNADLKEEIKIIPIDINIYDKSSSPDHIKFEILTVQTEFLHWIKSILSDVINTSPEPLCYFAEIKSLLFAVKNWLKSERKNGNRKKTPIELLHESRYNIVGEDFFKAYVLFYLKELDQRFSVMKKINLKEQNIKLPAGGDLRTLYEEALQDFAKYVEKHKDKITPVTEELCLNLLLRIYPQYVFDFHKDKIVESFETVSLIGQDTTVKVIKSYDLLALAWKEIFWAMDNHYYVNLCDYCGKLYTSERMGARKYCDSKECKKMHIKMNRERKKSEVINAHIIE